MSKTLKAERMPKYAEGELSCRICSSPLPAHQDWAGAPLRSCGSDECVVGIKNLSEGRYIEAGAMKCQVVNCANLVPEGRYRRSNALLCCSAKCWWHLTRQGIAVRTCSCGCGTQFHRHVKKSDVGKPIFLNSEHWGRYSRGQFAEENVGPFKNLFYEYLTVCEALGLRAINQVRSGLYPFFIYLNEIGITDLDAVKPATINQYLSWAKRVGRRSVAAQTSTVSTFFDWLIVEDRRKYANPVIKKFHSKPKCRRVPRPLEAAESKLLWEILEADGSSMLRLAAAIGEEAGLRASEVCNLRLRDVFLMEQKLFVRLPNKGMEERWAFFGEKTRRYYIQWTAERRTDCDHDGLLHNRYGGRLKYGALRDEYLRTLSKLLRSERGASTGFDRWLTHRLRHTFATNLSDGGADAMTIKGLGGWKSFQVMEGYIQTNNESVGRGYHAAMKKAAAQKEMPSTKRTLTLAELLERKRAQHSEIERDERGVVARKDCV